MSLNLLGDKVLMARLAALPAKAQKAIIPKALRAGSAPMVRAIRRAAPVYTGNLRRSIGVTVKPARRGGTAMSAYAKAGARRGFTILRGVKKPSEARAGQYGSIMNAGRKDGTRPKHRGWLNNAARGAEAQAMAALVAGLRQGFNANMRSW